MPLNAVRLPGVPLSLLIPPLLPVTKICVLTPTGCAVIVAPLPLDAAPTLTSMVFNVVAAIDTAMLLYIGSVTRGY